LLGSSGSCGPGKESVWGVDYGMRDIYTLASFSIDKAHRLGQWKKVTKSGV